MKKLFWLIIIIPVVFLVSCNKQIASLSKSDKLIANSAPIHQQVLVETASGSMQQIATPMISPNPEIANGNKPKMFVEVMPIGGSGHISPVKQKMSIHQQMIRQLSKTNDQTFKLATHKAAIEESRFNKVGLILIGAGIVALLINLIIEVWIILIVLGLIIFFAPLFRKRRY